ncbi:MAG: protein kinase [Symploca sp. SIO1C4]|uniref:Protein kinase n=1 Tax=Symploca sp. SIO1C4 TaxID=2607765 RepID=A0A6B3N0T7_9CYAN|nr:protein kinase [Symploca sp. SIO1C4]
MSYCFNPNCSNPQNPESNKFCSNCGTKLLLAQRYRALKPMAQGGFGRTFLAEDEYKPSKPRCVIKQFYPQAGNSALKAAKLFHQEALRLEKLGKHPQIPELLAHFEQDNYLYIVQEFIDGQNLAQELAESGAFPEVEIRHLLAELLPVLQFIHTGKVIHRDIKPENIIRRRLPPSHLCTQEESLLKLPPYLKGVRGSFVLVDFGAAKYATPATLAKTGTTIGSAGYAAPEQIFGKAVFASDIYSLGVTCIHLLTQLEPFDLYDVLESGFVWRHYLVNNPVSEQLANVLTKMVQSAVRQRYQSAQEVMQDLLMPDTIGKTKMALPVSGTFNLANTASQQSLQQANSRVASAKLSLISTITGHSGTVYAIAFSPDGQILASGSADKTIKLWQLKMAWEIRTLGGWFSKHSDAVRAVAFSPNGKIIASGSDDKTIKLWNVRNGQHFCTLSGHSDAVSAVAFSPNSKILATSSADKTIKLWDVQTWHQLYTLTGHSDTVIAVAFSPNGKTIATSSADKTVRLWDVRTGEVFSTITSHSWLVDSVAFSPNGQIIASGSADKMVRLWDVYTGQQLGSLKGHLNGVSCVAFSSDGQILASGSWDNSIKLWNVSTGKHLCEFRGHLNGVSCVVFSPDGRTLASGSWDNSIKIWRVITTLNHL